MTLHMHFARTAAAVVLGCVLGVACNGSSGSNEPTPDLSKKARVVTFDVSGMT